MLQFYPTLEFSKAKRLLSENGWDLNRANQAYIDSQCKNIKLVDKSTGIQVAEHKFNQECSGMDIIYFLQQVRNSNGQYFNIYKDRSGNDVISYTMLTCPIDTLALPDTLYFAVEAEPKY